MAVDSIVVKGNTLDITYTPPQFEFFYKLPQEYPGVRFFLLPKGRRFGATHGAGNFSIESSLDTPDNLILWVDTIQTNLDRYFTRYFLPTVNKIKPEYWRYRAQYKDFNLVNSQMDFRSAEKPQNIEGFAYKIIIINEAGIVLKGQKGRDLWFNTIYPMVMDYRAIVYFLGTPKGKKAKKDEAPKKTSLYYDLCLKGGLEGRDRDEKYLTLRHSSYDNPLLDPVEIQELEADVPRVTRAQEIYGKFVDLGDEEVFKADWFNIVYELPPEHLWRRKVNSLDTAFKKGAENDDSAGVCFLETTVGYFWLDTFCEKLEFPELIKKAKEFYLRHHPDLNLIEDRASGQSLIQMFKSAVDMPVLPTQPDSDKYSRACAVTPLFETGKVFLLFGAWNDMAIDQLCDFNIKLDTPDDIVDAVSQILNFFRSKAPPKAPLVTRQVTRTSKILKGY